MGSIEKNLLIVDDDANVLESLVLFLDLEFDTVKALSNANLIPETIKRNHVKVVLLDMNFEAGRNSGNEGLYWLRQIKAYDENIEVVMFTAYGGVELAVQCIKEGAFDFVLKPWENHKLLATLQAACKLSESKRKASHLEKREQQLSQELSRPFQHIIGDSPVIRHVFNLVEKVAKTEANVLVLGENGTGKELVAREIHNQSNRKNAPFIRVDLGSLSDTLFESELFGYVKGAFTDAKKDKPGRFEIASGGTLFLDEIGNVPLNLQQKLLSVIERDEIIPLGSNQPVSVDVRLICATNLELNRKVQEKQFREDLLYRINTIQVKLPPLRQRGDDILKLADFFLKNHKSKYNKPNLTLDKQALLALKNYSWPGNVRELEHAIERAVILSEGKKISQYDLGFNNTHLSGAIQKIPQSLADIERQAIIDSLECNEKNLSETAKELQITRQTLYNKINKYKIYL